MAATLGDKSIPAVFNPMEIWQPLTRATFTHVEMVGGFLSPNLNINYVRNISRSALRSININLVKFCRNILDALLMRESCLAMVIGLSCLQVFAITEMQDG